MKNIVAQYHKIRDSNRKGGRGEEFLFYKELDVVLAGRPASEPSVLLSSNDHKILLTFTADICLAVLILK